MRPISRCGVRWPIFRKVSTAEQAAGAQGRAGMMPASHLATAMAFPTYPGQSLPEASQS